MQKSEERRELNHVRPRGLARATVLGTGTVQCTPRTYSIMNCTQPETGEGRRRRDDLLVLLPCPYWVSGRLGPAVLRKEGGQRSCCVLLVCAAAPQRRWVGTAALPLTALK